MKYLLNTPEPRVQPPVVWLWGCNWTIELQKRTGAKTLPLTMVPPAPHHELHPVRDGKCLVVVALRKNPIVIEKIKEQGLGNLCSTNAILIVFSLSFFSHTKLKFLD